VFDKELASAVYRDRICFNYSDFLSASCKKRWSFVDAIYGVLPIFGMVTRKSAHSLQASEDQLKELALQIISTYPLSDKQLEAIHEEYPKPVALTQQDDLLCVVLDQAH